MTTWSRKLAIFLGGSLLLPLTSELAVSRIKNEDYNFGLAATLVLIVGPIALLLYYARPVRMTARLIMSLGLMAAGLSVASLGFTITTWAEAINDAHVPIGIATVVVGLIVGSIGGLYFGRERFDVPIELPAPRPPTDPTQVKIERFPNFRSATHAALIDRIVQHINTLDLHYVAYYVDGRCVMSLDLLDHPDLARFHEVTEPYQRREEYLKQGKNIDDLLRRLNEEFRPLNTGDLIRLVLDVERGAIYHFVVTTDTNRFLIGVTLDQHKVHIADDKMATLVDEIRVHLGQPRMTELEQVER